MNFIFLIEERDTVAAAPCLSCWLKSGNSFNLLVICFFSTSIKCLSIIRDSMLNGIPLKYSNAALSNKCILLNLRCHQAEAEVEEDERLEEKSKEESDDEIEIESFFVFCRWRKQLKFHVVRVGGSYLKCFYNCNKSFIFAEEIEQQKAHERHMTLQEQGKQARKGLERLDLIRQQRAEAAKKREEEKAAKEQRS
ncbi:hypothetical protein ACH5RR_018043 [Cinchona calisaya]|uniref:Casein kinase substrate phosphoprotein PP28 domain-containing protein n=1 Tax=Cinchona calisaya TaxID=153742 RepID=A0ABD2ZKY0_9GENT